MLDEPSVDDPPVNKGGRPPLDETPEGILQSEHRKRILELVHSRPGARVGDLQREADMTAGTFYYHITHLKRAGLVETHSSGGVTRAYPAGQVVPHENTPLDHQAVRNVAKLVLRKPGMTSNEVAEILELATRTAQLHLNTLLRAGYVKRISERWLKRYEPTEKLQDALRKGK